MVDYSVGPKTYKLRQSQAQYKILIRYLYKQWLDNHWLVIPVLKDHMGRSTSHRRPVTTDLSTTTRESVTTDLLAPTRLTMTLSSRRSLAAPSSVACSTCCEQAARRALSLSRRPGSASSPRTPSPPPVTSTRPCHSSSLSASCRATNRDNVLHHNINDINVYTFMNI